MLEHLQSSLCHSFHHHTQISRCSYFSKGFLMIFFEIQGTLLKPYWSKPYWSGPYFKFRENFQDITKKRVIERVDSFILGGPCASIDGEDKYAQMWQHLDPTCIGSLSVKHSRVFACSIITSFKRHNDLFGTYNGSTPMCNSLLSMACDQPRK